MPSSSASPLQSQAKPRGRFGCLSVGLTAVSLLGWLGVIVYLGFALQSDLRALEALARQPLAQVNFDEVGQTLHQARSDSLWLRRLASPLLAITPALNWVPHSGNDLAAAEPLLDLTVDSTLSADETFVAIEPLLNELTGSTSETPSSLLIKTLPTAMPHLRLASQALKRVELLLPRLNSARLS